MSFHALILLLLHLRVAFCVKEIHIGGLFPMNGTSGWIGGQGCLPAIQMALNDVNKIQNLMPEYKLHLHWNNSQCDPGLGSRVLYDLIYEPPVKTLILCGCSIVCSTIAEVSKMYNLIVLGYGSSSPALSQKERFPTFFRTHPSAAIQNPTRIRMFKKFGWSRIAIILEAEEVFITTGKDLEVKCKESDIEIVARVSFLANPTDAVKSLYRQDARIIVGMFYSGAARRVMCEAYKNGYYGKQYVWFLIGWYEDNWYYPVPGLNCTLEQMRTVVEGHFTTEALMLNQDDAETIAGVSAKQWMRQYMKLLNDKSPEGVQEAPLAYDAIWTIAYAFNATIERLKEKRLKLEQFSYQNREISDSIRQSLQTVNFLGVSGRVAFSQIGDRIAWTQIEQMDGGRYTTLGFYDTNTDNLTWFNREKWFVTGRPPRDRTGVVHTLKTVNSILFVSLSVVSVIGILMAFSLIIFNWKFQHYKYIQMSHPQSNNVMLLGCVFCFVSVILFGFDGKYVPKSHFTVLCNARAWFISLGFSLFFGSMFTKIWYCHLMNTHSKRKRINNRHFYLIIAAFCVVDGVILLVWRMRDPIVMHIETFPAEVSDIVDDIRIEPQLEQCEANPIWYGLLYGYKGLLLLFGLFLSYETRSVKLKQLNDSRLVGMSIYNVVILCVITGPVSLVISKQVDSHYAFIGLAITFCCFLTMALVFVPKIVELVRRKGHAAAVNGFHETMSSREEEEKYQRMLRENDELKERIAEKEKQIEAVRDRIATNERKKRKVTIKERLIDPDSGFTSNRNNNTDFEFSESYL